MSSGSRWRGVCRGGIVVGTYNSDIEFAQNRVSRERVRFEQGIGASPNGFGIALAEQFGNAEIAF